MESSCGDPARQEQAILSGAPPQGDAAQRHLLDESHGGAAEEEQHHAGREFTSLPPTRLLLLFCSINLLNYVDRGMLASNGVNGSAGCPAPPAPLNATAPAATSQMGTDCAPSGIQGDFMLSNFGDGLLPTAFLVGLLAASPLFAHASKTHSPALLMGVGLAIWTLAVLGCAASWGFVPLLLCRMMVGVGEASFISLAAPCISDCSPPAQASLWLACFYLCIPVGFALGFIYGSVVAGLAGWRAAFAIEALLMLPFVAFLFHRSYASRIRPTQGVPKEAHAEGVPGHVAPPEDGEPQRLLPHGPQSSEGALDKGGEPQRAGMARADQAATSLLVDLQQLAHNPHYVRNLMGYAAYSFVLGAYAFWGPKATKQLFSLAEADTIFGAITVITGVGGTLAGGILLDRLGSSLPTAFKLMGVATAVGGAFCLLAFLSTSLALFIVFISIGELFLFAIQSPANVVTMGCVPPVLRSLAIATGTIGIHVLGDVPSPPLVGALQDAFGSFHLSMALCTLVLFPAALVWYSGSWINVPRRQNSSESITDSVRQGMLSNSEA